jgi:adenylate kinase family enzyme
MTGPSSNLEGPSLSARLTQQCSVLHNRSAMQRIVVLGTSGSGKSTLARQLGSRLSLPYFEMDSLHWNPSWKATPLPEFRHRVQQAVQQSRWVTEGNYSVVRDLLLERADTLIWLDYSFGVVFSRLFSRSLRRIILQERVCNGNLETFAQTFLSRESVLLWAIQTYRRRRRQLSQLFAQRTDLKLVRFGHPRQTQAWLEQLKA